MTRPGTTRAQKTIGFLTFVVVLATALVLGFGDRLAAKRFFTDGAAVVGESDWDEAMRFVWQEGDAGALEGADSPQQRAPSFHPATGDVYFSRRTPTGDWDLYRARFAASGYQAPEPLFELNTPSDETDPVLTDGGSRLVFSSNRPGGAGGFDIFDALLVGDGFAPAKLWPRPLNSEGDDVQPTFDARARRLVFASTRLDPGGNAHDLFECVRVDGAEFGSPELLRTIAAEDGEIRAPALSPDGLFLYFASDRAGGRGGFDIYRSLRFGAEWKEPVAVLSLNTAADETDPALSGEGTRLLFARRRDAAAGGFLLRAAERRELSMLSEARDLFLRQLLYALLAVLAALLATYVYLRWRRLHPFIKFIILSILAHILFLLWIQRQRGGDVEAPILGDGGFSVTFLSSGAEAGGGSASAVARTGASVAVEKQATAALGERRSADAGSAPEAIPAAGAGVDAPVAVVVEAVKDVPGRSVRRADSTAAPREELSAEAFAPKTAADGSAKALRTAATPTAAASLDGAAELRETTGVAFTDVAAAAAPEGAAPTSFVAAGAERAARSASEESAATAHGPTAAIVRQKRADIESDGAPAATADARKGSADLAPLSKGKSAAEVGARQAADASLPVAHRESLGGGSPAAPDAAPGIATMSSSRGAASHLQVESPAPIVADARSARGADRLLPSAGSSAAAREGPARTGADESAAAVGPTAKNLSGPRERSATALGSRDAASRTGESGESAVASTAGIGSGLEPRRALVGGDPAAEERSASSGRRSRAPLPTTPGGARGEDEAGAKETSSAADPVARTGSPGPRSFEIASPRGIAGLQKPASQAGGAIIGRAVAVADIRPPSLLLARPLAGVEPVSARPEGVYANRRGAAKIEALKRGGGSDETEAAVLAGLRYLQRRQREDGAWGRLVEKEKYGDVRIGKTGLAILAFLGSGYSQLDQSEFAATIRSGFDHLIAQQDAVSGHIGQGEAYSHGIAAYALAEGYALTKDEKLKEPLRRAVRRIVRAQIRADGQPIDGGWSYYYADPLRRYDRWPRLSITVWQIMALESAALGGIDVPDAVMERAKAFVLESFDEEMRAFRYNHDPNWLRQTYRTLPGSTSAAIFAMQLLGVPDDDPRMLAGVDFVMDRLPTWTWRRHGDAQFVNDAMGNLYFHYYATLGLFRRGGEDWRRWNDALTRLLLEAQAKDGSWRPIDLYSEYADDADDDRVFTTSMSVLMLEVYYRYFTPLLRHVAQKALTAESPAAVVSRSRVLVEEVEDGSAAARAGLRIGDILIQIGDRMIDALDDVRPAVDRIRSGRATRVVVERDQKRLTLTIRSRLEGMTIAESD